MLITHAGCCCPIHPSQMMMCSATKAYTFLIREENRRTRENGRFWNHRIESTHLSESGSSWLQSLVFITNSIQALLYYATCLAILLRHKLNAKLQGVTCLVIIKSCNTFVATNIISQLTSSSVMLPFFSSIFDANLSAKATISFA